jgi:hypothetical protein
MLHIIIMNFLKRISKRFSGSNISVMNYKKSFLKKMAPGISYVMHVQAPKISTKAVSPTEFYMKFHFIEGGQISVEKFQKFVDKMDHQVLKDVLEYIDNVESIEPPKPGFFESIVLFFTRDKDEEPWTSIQLALDHMNFKNYELTDIEKEYVRMIEEGEISSFVDFLEF